MKRTGPINLILRLKKYFAKDFYLKMSFNLKTKKYTKFKTLSIVHDVTRFNCAVVLTQFNLFQRFFSVSSSFALFYQFISILISRTIFIMATYIRCIYIHMYVRVCFQFAPEKKNKICYEI